MENPVFPTEELFKHLLKIYCRDIIHNYNSLLEAKEKLLELSKKKEIKLPKGTIDHLKKVLDIDAIASVEDLLKHLTENNGTTRSIGS